MIRLTGGRVIDPANGRDEVADLVIHDGRVIDKANGSDETVIDISGYVVAPGFVDLVWEEDVETCPPKGLPAPGAALTQRSTERTLQ